MMYKKLFLLFTFSYITFLSASAQQKKFTLLPSSITGINFRNDIVEEPSMFYYLYEYLYIGCGVAIGDVNNDGLQDIYFSNTRGSNKLYLNLGNFTFKDITEQAGVSSTEGIKTGVNMADINGDGFLDIIVCKSGYKDAALRKKNIYINNGFSPSPNGEGRGEVKVTFTDKADALGLADASYTIQSYVLDYDNDGDMDVYFLNHPIDFSKSMTIPATMKNGKMVYAEDTATTFVSDRLYENRNGKFIDVTKKVGIINHAFGLSASIHDFNGDGYPDIYVANDFNKPDFLYINNKNGTFTDKLTSYVSHTSFSSMGSDVADINNDGLEDFFVADMAIEEPTRQKQLFAVNQNYDKFQLLLQFNLFYQYPRNSLQLKNTDGSFSEIGNHSGVAETEWSWAPLIADFDNDGNKDIYITNGLKRDITDWDYKVFVLDSVMNTMNKGQSVDFAKWLNSIPQVKTKNYFYRNNGTLVFDKITDAWMDEPPSFSSGAAYADLDNDGDLDLVVNNVDDEAFVFKNNTREASTNANFLRFAFFKSPTNKVDVYGATVTLYNAEGKIQIQHYQPQRGFLSSTEHLMHFGIGTQNEVTKAEIIFPTGKKIILQNIKANQVLTIYESDAKSEPKEINIKAATLFTDISSQKKLNYTQIENDFIDFKREPLIPYKCSRKGPYFALGDVNGDGLQDVFIGGSAGTAGKLMLQNSSGQFLEKPTIAFVSDKQSEDMDAIFFDADGDKDLDLYVVSGGAQFSVANILYQDRLYINDGKGNFIKSISALPKNNYNGSCVVSLDFDNDGDNDLFIGGHILPGKFPQAENSMLLQNNKGIFTNVTTTIAKDLLQPGMVSSAVWQDADGDGQKELTLAGEWMPVSIFKMQNGQFTKQQQTVHFTLPNTRKDTTINMNEFNGWWYSIKADDVNGDGKIDFILGNRGTNCSIKGDYNNPCTVYAKDFDGNGSYDAVLGYYNQGQCYPLFSRDQLIDQMPGMRKKFIRYKDYSGTTLDNLFTAQQKVGMDIYKTHFFESGVLLNEGNNSFRFIPFPEMAQLSTINDIVIDDFDKDGIKDILVCGNNNDAAVMVGNIDATAILLLKGDGIGQFTAVSHQIDGLAASGEVRKLIYVKQNKLLVLLKNSAMAQVFRAN